MKVFFDYAIFTLQRFGGVSNYIVNLVENFSDQVDPLIISLFYKNHYLKNSSFSDKLFFYKKVGSLVKYINRANKIYFNYQLKKKKPDIVHLTYFNEPVFNTDIFSASGAKTVVTEYDLTKEKIYADQFKDQIKYKKTLFEKADQIICISNSVKKDLQQHYSIDVSKISVVHLAANKDKSFRERSLNIKPFILFVGDRQRYKGFKNTIKAYAGSTKLKSNFDFVCFGGGNFLKAETDLFRKLSIDKINIHYFEGDKLDLNYFYYKARMFIFPSLYEGFGIPLLEAMNMECPVICSDIGSFSEIVNDAAIFFDPVDIESIQFKMEKLIFDDQLLLDLKTKGNKNFDKYSWKKCSNETEQLYKKILS